MQQAVPYRWHWLWWRRDAQWGHSGRRPAAVSLWTTSCHGSRFWLTQPYTRGTWDLSRQKGNTSVVSLWNNGSHQLQLPAMIANSLPLRKTLNWTPKGWLAGWLPQIPFALPLPVYHPHAFTTGMLWNAGEQLLLLRPINLNQITAHDHHNSYNTQLGIQNNFKSSALLTTVRDCQVTTDQSSAIHQLLLQVTKSIIEYHAPDYFYTLNWWSYSIIILTWFANTWDISDSKYCVSCL